MVLKRGHFGKQIRNTWEVSKSRAGEGWLKKLKGRLTGLVTS